MEPVTVSGVDFTVDGDELVASIDGLEMGRAPLAAANMEAEELFFTVKAACYANSR